MNDNIPQPDRQTSAAQGSLYYRNDDEISLVDLASILVKRWKAMAIIFTVIVLAALAYALMMPRTYSYTSLYNVAEQGVGEALEAPAALVAKVRSIYLGPQTRALLASEELESLPFETTLSNPEDTLFLGLSSQADENDVGMVKSLHEGILQRVEEGQQALVERRREALERQLESANEALEALRDSDSSSAGELIATYTSRIANLETNLVDLRSGVMSQIAVQSLEPVGTSRRLIMAMALVLGGLLAVMGAFFIQFIGLVRSSLKDGTT